ncbi:hypothetical protein NMG60_11006315 [Bertholletia excelsa]
MISEMTTRAFLHLSSALLLILLAVEICKAASAETDLIAQRNSTVAEFIRDEEFLMESETTRRILAGQARSITYEALKRPSVCNVFKQGDCSQRYNDRNGQCAFYDRCKRSPR